MATEENLTDSFNKLLQSGADVNKTDEGEIGLIKVARYGHTNIVNQLLKAGANVNITNKSGDTALMAASEVGHVECVKSLIAGGADVNFINKNSHCRGTALICAVQTEHVECMEALTEAGVDVNAVNIDNETALHPANDYLHRANLQTLNVLLKAGADVNSVDNVGATPLMYASGCDIFDGINYYHADKESKEEVARVRVLLEAGAAANKGDEDGRTAIMAAVTNVLPGTTKQLIEAGADVNTADNEGRTPLMFACQPNPCTFDPESNSCVRLILKAGAYVNQKDSKGLCLLDVFAEAEEQSMERLMLLLAAGETTERTTLDVGDEDEDIEVNIADIKQLSTLKGLSRETIRQHLLQLSPVNLFCRIPQLQLPDLITAYLLYNVSLEGRKWRK